MSTPLLQSRSRRRLLPHLREWRERRLMTQTALAAHVGVSKSLISLVEHQRSGASFKTIKALAKALGISPQTLMQRSPRDL